MVASLLPHVADRPHAPAITDESGTTSWLTLNDRANRWVWVLRGLGLEEGDRVAVMTGNRREAWEVFLACLHAGLVLVLIPWDADRERVRFMLRHSSARVLIVEEATRAVAADAAMPDPNLPRFTLDGSTGTDRVRSSAEALVAVPGVEPDEQLTGGPMFYTSGTTGQPKGVVSAGVATAGAPIEALAGAVGGVVAGLRLNPEGCAMIVGPNYHSGQFVLSTFPLLAGQTLVVRRGPDPEEILRTIDAFQVTNCLLLPADLAALLRLPPVIRARLDGRSLQLLLHGGAPCPPSVRQGMIDWVGDAVTEYYGATEGGLFALSTAEDFAVRPDSVGKVLPIIEVRIVGPDGVDVPAGEEGAIYLRPTSGAAFRYHEAPEKTAEAYLADGWFTVGDVGRVDEDGYLHVSGRAAHMVTVGSVWVHPGRVEATVAEHPGVADAGAFKAEFDGGRLHLSVVPAADADAAGLGDGLREHLADRLGDAWVPVAVHLVDAIPRSAAGKILRHELQEMAQAAT